jgi:hypothetical protein
LGLDDGDSDKMNQPMLPRSVGISRTSRRILETEQHIMDALETFLNEQ